MEKAAKPDWGGPATLQKEGTSTSTSGVLPLVPETRWKWQQARTAHHWHCTSKQCLPCFLKPPPCNCFYSQDKLHPKLHTETPSQISPLYLLTKQNQTVNTNFSLYFWMNLFISVNYYLETSYPKKQALLLFNHITAYRQLLWDSSLFTVESRITLILNNQKHCEDSTQSMLFPSPEEHIKQKTSVKKHS